ncbi:Hypothetical_protein [Hexamita inflata]|uniref:Hypothetical_protein n=1 Tax=Hexamita inflata TaxID=28002 RepID=A0AA86PVP1_9EUKA|nr:Hypothetical protein HINF_LOCUS29845 [Hexamita inflata]
MNMEIQIRKLNKQQTQATVVLQLVQQAMTKMQELSSIKNIKLQSQVQVSFSSQLSHTQYNCVLQNAIDSVQCFGNDEFSTFSENLNQQNMRIQSISDFSEDTIQDCKLKNNIKCVIPIALRKQVECEDSESL